MPREDVTVFLRARDQVARGIDKAAGKFAGFGSKVQGSIRGIGMSLGILQLASTAAFTAMAKDVVDLGVQFESSMIAVKAVASATEIQFESLEATARETGKETIFTASETANAMYDLASAGLEVQDIIGALPGVISLAVSQQASLKFTTETVTSTLATFNIEASQTAHVADVFAEAISSSKLNLDKLSTALAFAGPAAAGFNIGLEETVAGLGAFANMGLTASMIGTTFRMGLIQLQQAMPAKETLNAAQVVEKLGLTFDEINPSVVGLTGAVENLRKTNINMQDAIALFGARAAGPFLKLITDVNVDLRAYTERLEKANKAQAIMTEVMGTTRSSMKEFKSASEELKLAIFDNLQNPIQVAFKQWTDWLRLIRLGKDGFQEAAVALSDWNAPIATQMVRLEGWEEALRAGIDAADGLEASTNGLLKTSALQRVQWTLARAEGWKVLDAMKELGFEFETQEEAIRFVRAALSQVIPQYEQFMAATDGAVDSTDDLNDGLDETGNKIIKVGHTAEAVQMRLASSLAQLFSELSNNMEGSAGMVLGAVSALAEGALGIMQTVKFVSEITSASVKATLGPILIILEVISAILRLFGVFRSETAGLAAPVTSVQPAGGGGGMAAPIYQVNINGDVLGDGDKVSENIREALAGLKMRTGRTVEQGAF